jgi:pyruvate, orthophosphate dikinase
MLAQGRIDAAQALRRVTPDQFAAATGRHAAATLSGPPLARGLGVSPGIAAGIATFDPERAVDRGARGEPVILIRTQTRPEDLPALLAAAAFVTTRGGRTSHAAVIGRATGRPCVTGLDGAVVDVGRGVLQVPCATVADGDLVTVDGTHGILARGGLATTAAPGKPEQLQDRAVGDLLAAADECRRMQTWANADSVAEALAARQAGASGIGLCRTEHMFLGERLSLLTEVLIAPYTSTAQEALGQMHRLQRADFTAILSAMDGLPVTVRLLDPPRHEFLPDLTELSVRAGVARARGERDPALDRLRDVVERLAERNPMLGVRGVRLGVLLPWLYEMQITALAEAALARISEGGDPRPRLLVPMVATTAELLHVRAFTVGLVAELQPLADRELALPVGAMIETPRAALTAAEVARAAEFFSFGTNDLTQLTWGLSRDDTEAAVLRPYEQLRLIPASPFERLDRTGVGELIRMAVRAGRLVRPGMSMGICGAHAADPASIMACHDWGLDYVSCPVPDIPVARYSVGYAAARPARAQAREPADAAS